jgi:hypothetical protein
MDFRCGAFAVAALFVMGSAQTFAQESPDSAPDFSLSAPGDNFDPSNPPRFEKPPGNPPGFGAGKTGFISKKKPAAKKKVAVQPLAPVQTGRTLPTAAPLPTAAYASFYPATPTRPAQTIAITPPKPKPKAPPETDPYDPLGIRLGSFVLKPAIELTGGYDTNPGRGETANGSSIFSVAPELAVRSDWSRHDLRADLKGSYNTFGSQPSLNRPYFESKIDARIDWTHRTWIDLENRFLLSTDDPGSPNLQATVTKIPYFTTLGGTAGLGHRFNRLELTAKGSVDRTRYQDSQLSDGTMGSNADRNLTQAGLQLRGSYEVSPALKPFVELDTDRRVHDVDFDRNGVQRDSAGFSPQIGTSFEFSRILTGKASIGYVVRNYKDPSLSALRGLITDASLIWSATPLTTATFTARSSADETTVAGVSGVLTRDFGVQIDHTFRRWLIGTVKVGYGLDDYVISDTANCGCLVPPTERQDRRFSVSAGITYKFTRELQAKGEVRQEMRRSNQAGNDYTATIVLLGLRLQR